MACVIVRISQFHVQPLVSPISRSRPFQGRAGLPLVYARGCHRCGLPVALSVGRQLANVGEANLCSTLLIREVFCFNGVYQMPPCNNVLFKVAYRYVCYKGIGYPPIPGKWFVLREPGFKARHCPCIIP